MLDRIAMSSSGAMRFSAALEELAQDAEAHEKIIVEKAYHRDGIHVGIVDRGIIRCESWIEIV